MSHVEITFRINNALKILVGKIVRKKPKLTELKKMNYVDVDWIHATKYNGPSDFIKDEILYKLRNCYFFKRFYLMVLHHSGRLCCGRSVANCSNT
jgi:hypothetical protein